MILLLRKSSKVKTFFYQHVKIGKIDKSKHIHIDSSVHDHRKIIKTEKKEKEQPPEY